MARPKGTKNKNPGKRRAQQQLTSNAIDHGRALALLREGGSSTILPLPKRTIGGLRDQVLKLNQCNCKRSSCLKLYCECFAGGICCNDACCCVDCRNLEKKYNVNDLKSENAKNKDNAKDKVDVGSTHTVVGTGTRTDNANSKDNITANRSSAATGNGISPQKSTIPTLPQSIDQTRNEETDMRFQAIINILDRNPHAFRPKATTMGTSSISDTISSTITSQSIRNTTAAVTAAANATSSSYNHIIAKYNHSHSNTNGNTKNRTKVGCNCRKSFCLKKYCECFQAALYCNSVSCRCQDCQNKPGNPRREQLINKSRRREEEKESLSLATLKYDTSRGGIGGSSTIMNGNGGLHSSSNDTDEKKKKVGGVPPNIAAIVSTGVAAAGVDLFLPASSYAYPMQMENGKIVSEISFGTVGRQVVGGKGGIGDSAVATTALENNIGKEGQRFTGIHDEKKKATTNVHRQEHMSNEDLRSYFDSLRVLLNTRRTSDVDVVADTDTANAGIVDTDKVDGTKNANIDTRKKETLSSWDSFIGSLEMKIQATAIQQPKPETIVSSQVSKIATANTPKQQVPKRSYDEFARDTIVEISRDVKGFKKVIDDAEEQAEKKFNQIVAQKKTSGCSDPWIEEFVDRKDLDKRGVSSIQQHIDNSLMTTENTRANANTFTDMSSNTIAIEQKNPNGLLDECKDASKNITPASTHSHDDDELECDDMKETESLNEDDLLCEEELQSPVKEQPLISGTEENEHNQQLSGAAMKELYILAAQDAALIRELARMIRERALTLARKRRKSDNIISK
jgi:hypothetical protein